MIAVFMQIAATKITLVAAAIMIEVVHLTDVTLSKGNLQLFVAAVAISVVINMVIDLLLNAYSYLSNPVSTVLACSQGHVGDLQPLTPGVPSCFAFGGL